MQRFASQREVAQLLRLPSFLEETRRVRSLFPATALLYRRAGEITVVDAMREDGVIHSGANHSCLHPVQRDRVPLMRRSFARLLVQKSAKTLMQQKASRTQS